MIPTFLNLFGSAPQLACEAPGRVNLIGEHTDYNGGYVLPMATPLRTRVELSVLGGEKLRAYSASIGGPPRESDLPSAAPDGTWMDYVLGTAAVLGRSGHRVPGFAVRIESDVPLGGGLSSSASLLVALLRALRQALGLGLDDVQLALLAQRVEREFVGAPVGIMDQMACSLAAPGEALLLDTASLQLERIALPPGAEIAVIDSGIRHRHAGGEYGRRRAECERAAALLGVASLRALSPADAGRTGALPPPLDRRVRHVVSENERVLQAADALKAGDLPLLGAVLLAGHASLRDDYEVSTPEMDLLVELSRGAPGVFGARLCGGGFGGSIVLVTARGAGRAAASRIAQEYAARTGRAGAVLLPGPEEGGA